MAELHPEVVADDGRPSPPLGWRPSWPARRIPMLSVIDAGLPGGGPAQRSDVRSGPSPSTTSLLPPCRDTTWSRWPRWPRRSRSARCRPRPAIRSLQPAPTATAECPGRPGGRHGGGRRIAPRGGGQRSPPLGSVVGHRCRATHHRGAAQHVGHRADRLAAGARGPTGPGRSGAGQPGHHRHHRQAVGRPVEAGRRPGHAPTAAGRYPDRAAPATEGPGQHGTGPAGHRAAEAQPDRGDHRCVGGCRPGAGAGRPVAAQRRSADLPGRGAPVPVGHPPGRLRLRSAPGPGRPGEPDVGAECLQPGAWPSSRHRSAPPSRG